MIDCMKTVLSIAGTDSIGGAGSQADIKTFSALGVYGMSVITSVYASNTCNVFGYQDISPYMVEKQIDAVFSDILPDAVKIGLLPCSDVVMVVAKKLRELKPANVVLDPVIIPKWGGELVDKATVNALVDILIPLSTIITPNLLEAERLSNRVINELIDMREAASFIYNLGCRAVVIKGVKQGCYKKEAVDILYDGTNFLELSAPMISHRNMGTGCTLSSAIAANLALGYSYQQSFKHAKNYVLEAMSHAPKLGKGEFGPISHSYELEQIRLNNI